MSDSLHITATVERYLARYPSEEQRLAPLIAFLAGAAPELYAKRASAEGHVTTSAFILSANRDQLLLIHHRKLNRFLQPGGHVENDVSLIASAHREVEEEVGLPAVALEPIGRSDTPFDIDPHRIPANSTKGEAEHWHFDFRYLFALRKDWEHRIRVQAAEVNRWRWERLDSALLRECVPEHVVSRLVSEARR